MLEQLFHYFEQNPFIYLEILGAILTIWCVYLASKNNILNWPMSMLASVVYFFVFFQNRFFSDAYLQVIFLMVQSYGWWYWSALNHSKTNKKITKITFKYALILLIFSVSLYFIWYSVYIKINPNARSPYIDTLCTVLSITALYMQAKHWLENWILWIVVDLIYVPMYLNGNQFITAALYTFLIVLAAKGFLEWKQKMLAEENQD